ncbi:MAG: polysulfide reductase NrfD [bacterium]|nr:polysulfide reductase NrfD [bacterium]
MVDETKKKLKIILTVLAGIGILAWIYQLYRGMIVTDMRNPFSWGLYIAMWAFYVGTAAGGLVVSSAIYVFKVEKLKPVARIASMTAFLFAAAAMIMVLPDLGSVERIYNFILHPNFSSVLVWDVIILSAYTLLSALYTYTLMKPDIAEKGIDIPFLGVKFKKELGAKELTELKEKSEKNAKKLAPIALVCAVLIHTVTAWVLATQLARPWWYGGLLAPTFIAAALICGPAIVILASMVTIGFTEKLKGAYTIMAKISAIAVVVLLFMYYNDFVVRAWWGEGKEFETIKLLFTNYWWLHLAEVGLMGYAAFLFFKKPEEKSALIKGSIFAITGVLAHRLLLIPMAYNLSPFKVPAAALGKIAHWSYPTAVGEVTGKTKLPMFVSHWSYFPSVIEILVTVGILSIILLAFFVLIEKLPAVIKEKSS